MTARIFVPFDTTARALGADDVAKEIRAAALHRGLDVEIVRNGSRGAFWLEPLVEVETASGRIAFGPVMPGDAEALFEAGFPGPCDHELSLGVTSEIPWFSRQQRLTFERAGLADPLSLDDYRQMGGYEGLDAALQMTGQQIVDAVKESGLRGRGGAAFPTGIKWQTVLDTDGDQKYIACNADEGDSGTFADRLLMEADPYQLIEGMTISGLAVGATQGYIYLRSEYPQALKILNEAISKAEKAGLLGDDVAGSGMAFHLEVLRGTST
jgi:formate dehydrogenase iron-sulfur subunit